MVRYNIYPPEDFVVKQVFDEVINTLKMDMFDAVEKELSEELENAIRDSIYKRVYAVYKPKQYIRRVDNHGLTDTSMYVSTIYNDSSIAGSSASSLLEIYLPHTSNTGVDLATIIESGEGYTWEYSEIYQNHTPRPFLEEAVQDIIEDHSAEAAIAEGLMRMGWDVNAPYKRKHTPRRNHKSPNSKRLLNKYGAF